jgi:hypothetical protein
MSADTRIIPTHKGKVFVEIWESSREGSRLDEIPTIVITTRPEHIADIAGLEGMWAHKLTWEEARALAAALVEVTDIAEHG